MSADLVALTEHVDRLADLVVHSVSHSNESANITLAVIATVFLPLTFIAGARAFLRAAVLQLGRPAARAAHVWPCRAARGRALPSPPPSLPQRSHQPDAINPTPTPATAPAACMRPQVCGA